MKTTREQALAFVDAAFRVLLGSVFVYAAWSKLHDPALFASSVDAYRMLPPPLVAFVAIVLPPAELIAGAALILTKWRRESALLLLGMLAVFLVGLVQAKVRGLEIGCGCFGGDAGDTVGDAIVRDVFLLVPAVWLVARGNGRAPTWKGAIAAAAAAAVAITCFALYQRPAKDMVAATPGIAGGEPAPVPKQEKARVQKSPEEAVAEIFAAFPAADTNSVAAEAWTERFPAALARARAEKRPLVMVVNSGSCPYCRRLGKAVSSAGFEKWIEGTGIYLASAEITPEDQAATNRTPMSVAMFQFLDASPHKFKLEGYPYVGVYWEKPSGETVWRAFCGRHGLMDTDYRPSLLCEFVNAVGELLVDYLAELPARPTESEMLTMTAKSVKVAVEGEGKVEMTPAHGTLLDDGKRVTAKAIPAKGWRFAGWRSPSGKMVKERFGNQQLVVTYSMPGGTYTAVFRRKAPAQKKKPPLQMFNGGKTT